MTHIRTVLRREVTAALKAAMPELKGHVFPSRSFTRALDFFPYVEVSTPSEDVQEGAQGVFLRTVTLATIISALDVAEVEDDLDALAEKIEAAMAAPALREIARFIPADMNFEIGTAGERTIGRTTIDWTAEVETTEDGTAI